MAMCGGCVYKQPLDKGVLICVALPPQHNFSAASYTGKLYGVGVPYRPAAYPEIQSTFPACGLYREPEPAE